MMVAINFIEPSGRTRTLEIAAGMSLKDAALAQGVEGIVGLCGGYASCGTCHIYVAEQDIDRLPPIEEAEEAMLDGAFAERLPGSRLSCQLAAGPELEGLTVTVAQAQM